MVLTVVGLAVPHCFTLRYKSSDYGYFHGYTSHLRYMDNCQTNPFWAVSDFVLLFLFSLILSPE